MIAELRRIGLRPVLIPYIGHHAVRRLRVRRLRRSYDALVGNPAAPAFRLPILDIPRRDELPAGLVADAARLCREAEAIADGYVEALGSGLSFVGTRPDWHRDFKSGYVWPPHFYLDLEVTRLADDSDAKVPWELSRSHHLLTLARAYRLTGDQALASALEGQLESWLAVNPTGRGINWANAMEVAIRAVNWIWILRTLPQRTLSSALEQRLARSLLEHGAHIRHNLEGTPYLRSNHFLSDLLGLVAVGAAFRDHSDARHGLEYARRRLDREVVRQVHPDGIGFEASLPYHGLALEIFLVAAELLALADRPFSPAAQERIARMAAASSALRHPRGRIPQFGDCDSGRILPGGFERPPTHDHLLSLSAVVLGTQPPPDVPAHPELAWTLGLAAWVGAQPSAATDRDRTSLSFPDGGIYVLRSNRIHLVVRCGDVGQNGNGGHAHNDLLSYELSVDDEPLIVDRGTYAYTSDARARNEFRSTRAHNVLSVDGLELNPIDPKVLFRLEQRARAVVDEWSPGTPRLAASHDGYEQIGVQLRRVFTVDGPHVHVEDVLTGRGRHLVESRVHLDAGVTVQRLAPTAFAVARGNRAFVIEWHGVDEVTVEPTHVSPQYGVRQESLVLLGRADGELPRKISVQLRAEADQRVAEVGAAA